MGKQLRAYIYIYIYNEKEFALFCTTSNVVLELFSNRRRHYYILFISSTGTFKLKKKDLQHDGFDPVKIKDKLYYLNSSGTYEHLNEEIYNHICTGKIRL
jgi:hypothetical protein